MITHHQLASFIDRRIAVGRIQPGLDRWLASSLGEPFLPTVEQFAGELVRDAEFRALQLGTFFSTPSGEFVEQAVALVIPRAFMAEFGLIVNALKLAAELQQGEVRGKTLLKIGAGVAVALLVKELGEAA